jgi:O-antigen ligase
MNMQKVNNFSRVLITTCVVVTLFITDKLLDPFNLPKFFFLVLGSTILVPYLTSKKSISIFRAQKFFMCLLAGFIVTQIVILIFRNDSIYRGLIGTWGRNNGLLSYTCLAIVAASGVVYAYNQSILRVIKVLSFLGLFESIYGVMQWQNADFFQWAYNGNKVILTLGNENFASILLLITIASTVHMLLNVKSDIRKIGYSANILLQLLVLIEINTAQSKIGLIIFGIIYLTYYAFDFARKRNLKVIWIYGAYLVPFALSIIGLFGLGPFSFINSNLGSLVSRYLHWVAAWNMYKANPLFGVGLDSYGDYMAQYRILDSNGVPDSRSDNAHNLFLQFLSTGGPLLLVSIILIFAYLIYTFVKIHKSEAFDTSIKALLASILAFFLINSGVGIDNLGVIVWFWFFSGLLVGLNAKVIKANNLNIRKHKKNNDVEPSNSHKVNVFISIVILSFLLPANYLVLNNLKVEYTLKKLDQEYRSAGYTEESAANLKNIALQTPDPNIRLVVIKSLYENSFDKFGFELAEDTAKYHPRNLVVLESVVLYLEKYGQIDEAIKVRKEQIRLDPLYDVLQTKLNELQKRKTA